MLRSASERQARHVASVWGQRVTGFSTATGASSVGIAASVATGRTRLGGGNVWRRLAAAATVASAISKPTGWIRPLTTLTQMSPYREVGVPRNAEIATRLYARSALSQASDASKEKATYNSIHEALAADVVSSLPIERMRNFCVIAHIDHGKSTLSDALLRATGCISEAQAKKGQVLDALPVERERGITVKATSASLWYNHAVTNEPYLLNLIDTPGHVDFSHEVSRSLASCQGALLLVDATQSLQAQTIGTLRQARARGLAIVPVVTKIDLPMAQPEDTAIALAMALGVDPEEVILTSARSGQGIPELLQAIADRLPSPVVDTRDPDGPLYARVIDSWFDVRRGVIALVQVVGGRLSANQRVALLASDQTVKESSSNEDSTGGDLFSATAATVVESKEEDLKRRAIRNAYLSVPGQGEYNDLDQRSGFSVQEIGVLTPTESKQSILSPGQVGYMVAGLRSTRQARGGDTLYLPTEWTRGAVVRRANALNVSSDITPAAAAAAVSAKPLEFFSEELKPSSPVMDASSSEYKPWTALDADGTMVNSTLTFTPLPGYVPTQPVLFATLYPSATADIDRLIAAVDKLILNDPVVTVRKEKNTQLGTGLRCGFLGVLHMEVFLQRITDEFSLEVVVTSPSVKYIVEETSTVISSGGKEKTVVTTRREVGNVAEWPEAERAKSVVVYEPVVRVTILTPKDYMGPLADALKERRAYSLNTYDLDLTADPENQDDHQLSASLVGSGDMIVLEAHVPWQEVVTDLHDQVQQASQGYASLNYEPAGFEAADLELINILVNGKPCDALATIAPRSMAQQRGRELALRLKDQLSRQNFEIVIQAKVANKIVARERISPYRKDVLSRSGKTVGGGDRTRKEKLLAKQREGKKRAKQLGDVEISQEAFWSVLKR